jgi:hypothetical protein
MVVGSNPLRKVSEMIINNKLSDSNHPQVQRTALSLTESKHTEIEKIESIFNFVRDEIPFGFPPTWDALKASETIRYGMGYCTPKATLFHALCKAAEIPSRIHAGLINIDVMRGILPAFAFWFLPVAGCHVWVEIQLNNQWVSIDSYINDEIFYRHALIRLHASGNMNGYSISEEKGASSCEFNCGEKGYVQMGAVVVDHGVWNDFSDYMNSGKYLQMNTFQSLSYRYILRRMANKKVQKIRMEHV